MDAIKRHTGSAYSQAYKHQGLGFAGRDEFQLNIFASMSKE